jgi:hypothetical protein
MPEQNQTVRGSLFNGKKIFEAMEITTRKELEEFLQSIVAKLENYAENAWNLSKIFATWIISKAPQVITN